MGRPALFEWERKLQAERCVKYRGTARVRLEHMHFEWNKTRELDRKNVERLKEVFRTESVRRLEPRNHIPAIVDQAELDIALATSKLSAERLLSNTDAEPPVLKFPARHLITCLHGHHRVQAARETLPPTDSWWIVDFYLKDSNQEFRTTLIEEYSNEEKPSDGEIYRKIRQYEREGNVCFKKRWKALLSTHGRRGLQQLLNHRDGELAAAFDSLLDIPGLWGGMRISTLHKIMNMKCDEEVIHYLCHIKDIWNEILLKDKAALRRVDQATVKALESKAPKHSKQDAQLLEGQLLSGQIFSAFSREERDRLWRNLRSVDGIIPSLFTLFEDIKYLSACADCLKRLVTLCRGETVSLAFQRKFPYNDNADKQNVIEIAESAFVRRSQSHDPVNLGYRQLWAFAMRHYRTMPPEAKKGTKDLLAKAAIEKADEEVVSEFAALADRLGFQSAEIQALKQRSSDAEIARSALLKARKPCRYEYDKTVMESHVEQITRLFRTATPISCQIASPTFVSENPDAPGNRCGFPDEDSQQRDQSLLFIPHLHQEEEEQGDYITSFFVRRSVYLAFFGQLAAREIDDLHETTFLQGMEMDEIESSEGAMVASIEADEDTTTRERDHPHHRESWRRLEREGHERDRREHEKAREEQREQHGQEQLEREQNEQERRELERCEQERLEQERLEQERLEQERRERQRGQEQREQEQLEQEQREQEQREREKGDQQAAKRTRSTHRYTQLELESLVPGVINADQNTTRTTDPRILSAQKSSTANSSHGPQVSAKDDTGENQVSNVTRITYYVRERGVWRTSQVLDVDPSNPTVVERVALKHMRKRIRLFDADLNILTPQDCFEAATNGGKNIILLIPEGEIDTGKDVEDSVRGLFRTRHSGVVEAPSKRGRK